MLENKTILITGSNGGIGAATARLAKKYGAQVVLHGRAATKDLKDLAKELQAEYIVVDATNKKAIEKAVKKIFPKVKKINALVNCVGVNCTSNFMESTTKEWEDVFCTNVLSTVNFSQVVIPYIQKTGSGSIVNIASIRGIADAAGRPVYSATKAAIINITASMAKELAPTIRVNAVAPGFTNTAMNKTWTEEVRKKAQNNLIGKVAEPDEIAETILFLLSDKASFVDGQTLVVDGGYIMKSK